MNTQSNDAITQAIELLHERYDYLHEKYEDLKETVDEHSEELHIHSSVLHKIKKGLEELEQELKFNLQGAKHDRNSIKESLERIESEAIKSVPQHIIQRMEELYSKGGVYKTLFIAAISLCSALVLGIVGLLTGLIPHP